MLANARVSSLKPAVCRGPPSPSPRQGSAACRVGCRRTTTAPRGAGPDSARRGVPAPWSTRPRRGRTRRGGSAGHCPTRRGGPAGPRPVGRYEDASPGVWPEPPVNRSVVVAEATRVQLHHQPVFDAHSGHLDEHVGREPGGVLAAGLSRESTGEDPVDELVGEPESGRGGAEEVEVLT